MRFILLSKFTKNQRFTLSLKNNFWKKKLDPPPVFLGLYVLLYVYYVNHSKKTKFN